MGNARDTGYLQNIVTYDANDNIVLPANLNVGGAATFATTVTAGGTSVGGTAIDSLNIVNISQGGGNLIIQNTSTTLGKIGVISEDIGSGTYNDGVFKVQLAADGTLQDRLTIASRGAATFSSTLTATNGIFISGSNDNRLGSGALTLLNYSNYNSSANQSITLGLGLAAAVDNNIAYNYLLNVSGNATGQNLTLSSRRNGIADLTILTINGTSAAATFGSSIIANGNIETNNGYISSSAGTGTSYSSRLSTVYNYPYVDTYLDSIAAVSYEGRLSFRTNAGGGSMTTQLSIFHSGAANFRSLGTGTVYSNSGTLTNAAPLITATGGTIVTTGGFKYHTFTSSGTFQVTAGSGLIEVFVLGGGGAGGGDFSGSTFYAGGGGSGGGLYHPAYYVEVGSYTVTVGAGGTPNVLSNGYGGDGNNSVFGNITALGGGGGSRGNSDSSSSFLGRNGGSGGGGGSSNGVGGISTQSITNGVAYGNNGATGAGIGGGGGGLGTTGAVGSGFGGFGKYILNQANRIGGGGGAGVFNPNDLGPGLSNGRDGGGTGGYWNGSNSSNSAGTAGTANTGGGGGGLGYNVGLGGAGGSGIVIVKYKV